MAYATLAQLKAYLGIAETGDDALLTDLLARAEATVNAYCGRRFEAQEAARRYNWAYFVYATDAERRLLLLDDDLLSISSLVNGDGTTVAGGDYWLEPPNGPPYYGIRLKSTAAWRFASDGEIVVRGLWGYSEVAPDDIVHATIRLAGYFYRQRDAQVFDVVAVPEAGVITVPQGIPRDVAVLLEPYRRRK